MAAERVVAAAMRIAASDLVTVGGCADGWVHGCYRDAIGRDIISMGGMGLHLCFVACHTIVRQAADLTLSIYE